ncbi:putative efflux protein, MATE family [Polaribacter sp. KT25b]|uniref:MATE family efflux transporter n=1 Tax=Polaribacter sp. KT25b TaxID=1855336 RepID=UPI000879CF65|nr:MATE family efflux transporter [Polaribacter sp. KT25b]SDR97057.1 putative efflux protein, MATE family [Polaribacter sp. KT25b]
MSNQNNIFNKLFLFLKEKKESIVSKTRNDNKKYSLKHDSILKLLIVFVGPAVLGMLINALYNFVDRIFVGQFVGVDGLSAVTMVFPVTLFQFGFVLLFGSGSGVLIAKYLGESKPEKAENILGNAIAGLMVIMLVFTSTGLLFYKPMLELFGASGVLLNLSAEYLLVIILGFPLSFFLALEFTCRAEGNPKFPAKLVVLSCIINVCLDYVFMKIFKLGIRGAALATVIAQATNVLLLMRYYMRGNSVVKLVWKKIRIQKHFIFPIVMVGFAPFLMDLAISFQNIFVNNLLIQSSGVNGVAAMGILFGVNVFFMMIALGTGDAMQPIVSFNFGAKRYDRASKTLELALKIVGVVAIVGVIIIEVFPTQITSVFIDTNQNQEVIHISKIALRIFAISIPFYAIQIIITRYFQALQKNKKATFLALLRPILLFIPITYLLNSYFGLLGIWASFPVSDGASAIISLFLVKKDEMKKVSLLNSNDSVLENMSNL